MVRCCGFHRLTAIWKTATVHLSNITEKCSHPAYERIIAMGTDVLPYIFEELDREPTIGLWPSAAYGRESGSITVSELKRDNSRMV